MKKIIYIVIGTLLLSTPLMAATITPLSVGIIPPVQFPSEDYTVTGLRLSVLWGHHRDVYGFDLGGLGNITDQDFLGTAVSGIFNKTGGSTTVVGAQLAGLWNMNTNKTKVIGVQATLGANINTADSKVVGLQVGLVNLSEFTDVFGVQVGLYNRAKQVYGIQIGAVNVTDNLHGLQIGVINFNHQGLIGVCPILNAGF